MHRNNDTLHGIGKEVKALVIKKAKPADKKVKYCSQAKE
jgi:hypothetical protein